MKKYLILSIFVTANISLLAQNSRWYYNVGNPHPDIGLKTSNQSKILQDKHVKSLDIWYSKELSGKTKKLGRTRYELNSSGYVTGVIDYDRKGKFNRSKRYILDSNNRVIYKVEINKKSDTTQQFYQVLDELGNRTKYTHINKKGRIVYEDIRVYDSTKIISQKLMRNGKPYRSYLYTYHPNGDKASTRLFNKRGKEKYVWEYDCKPEGVEVKKHKDTSTVCVAREYDENGLRTEVKRTTDEKGKMSKIVRKYNRSERLVSYEFFRGSEEMLVQRFEYEFQDDTVLMSERYEFHQDGKLKHSSFTQYNENSQITLQQYSHFNRRKKEYQTSKIEFVFDDGLLRKRQYLGYKGWNYRQEYSYTN